MPTAAAREATERRYCYRLLRMVHELHLMGFQRLRICPGMSASGSYWRLNIAPASNTLVTHGAMLADWEVPSASYSSADADCFFEWDDAPGKGPRTLAGMFVERFSRLAEQGRGRDWAYVGWYAEMLHLTSPRHLPVAYADWELPRDRLQTLQETAALIPLPPPGEVPEARR